MPFEYVCSRFYRAPEIVLSKCNYNYPVDMWSAGCIVAELYSGVPIFPATTTRELIELQELTLGRFPIELIKKYEHTKIYFKV